LPERPLYYLAAGLLCLCAVGFAGGRLGLAAFAVALFATAYSFLVYRWWVPPAAATAAAVAGLLAAPLLRSRALWAYGAGTAGLLLAAFSVFGPRDGLF